MAPVRDVPHADPELDSDGLLAALTLAPSTYSRNKYPALYARPEAMRVRRRARILRGLARQLASNPGGMIDTLAQDRYLVRIEIPELGYKRRSTLTQLERDLVVYLSARLTRERADEELGRVEAALARLQLPQV